MKLAVQCLWGRLTVVAVVALFCSYEPQALAAAVGSETNLAVTVRHGFNLNSALIEGSVWQLLGEETQLNGEALITGDLSAPGTPELRLTGNATNSGTIVGTGSTQPAGYRIRLNGNAAMRYLRTRVDPVALPSVPLPPVTAGTRNVSLNQPGDNPGSFSTIRDLSVNGTAGLVVVPPGTYRTFSANGGTNNGFVFGVTNATAPVTYYLQNLSFNGQTRLVVVSPVIIHLANNFTLTGHAGTTNQPGLLTVKAASGGVTLNGGSVLHAQVIAPAGALTLNGNALLVGTAKVDTLQLNGNGTIRWSGGGVPPPANQAPQVSAGTDFAIGFGETAALNGHATDDGLPAGSTLTHTWSKAAGPATGTVTFANPNATNTTATFSTYGVYVLRLTASDSALSASDTVQVIVNNHAPVASSQSRTNAEDTALAIALQGSDPDSDPLTYVRVTEPSFGTLTGTGSNLTYTPSLNFSGTDSFTFKVHDGSLDSAPATVTITVTPVNDAPVAFSQSVTNLEDTPFPITLTALDVDSDTLTFTVLTSPAAEAGTLSGTPPYLTFTPVTNFSGTAEFTFQVNDGGLDSGVATVSIVVAPVNDPPAADAGPDQLISVNNPYAQLAGVVVDDHYAGAVTSLWSVVSGPGTVTFADASLTNTAAHFSAPGVYVLQLYAADEWYEDTDEVVITVNDPPVITLASTASVNYPGSLSLEATVEDDGLPTNGVFAVAWSLINGPGTVTFGEPDATNTLVTFSDPGVYVLRLMADDGLDVSSAEITVTVYRNASPLMDAVANLVIDEDAGTQTVSLTGITPGPENEAGQTITITSTSSVPGLIPHPSVAYDGSNSVATLTFAPVTNGFGTATITVILQDNGGTTGGGVDAVTNTFLVTVNSVNDVPAFTIGADRVVLEDSGAQTVTGWATGLSVGPANEAGQSLMFDVSTSSPELFAVAPAIAANGTLTFTPALHAYGSATVTVTVSDDGGTANGGVDTSEPQTFTITVTSVNDAPRMDVLTNLTILEDSGGQTLTVTGLAPGPDNESAQTLVMTASSSNTNLMAHPVVTYDGTSPTGTLSFTPTTNDYGTVTITVIVRDNGGTADGGVDGLTNTFQVTVVPVNDAPSFVKGADQTVLEDGGLVTVTGWATAISSGPANESAQSLTFNVSNNNSNLFGVQPAITTNGTLTFTPAANAFGTATVTVTLSDDGGTANSGVDTSAPQTFTITVTGVNDAPTVTLLTNTVVVLEDSGANTVSNFAAYVTGPANESGQTTTNVTIVSVTNSALFSAGPALGTDGTLTFTPTANANGTALVTFTVTDDGGTANSGVNTSANIAFLISVTPVNDAPGITFATNSHSVLEDSGANTVSNFAAYVTGPANESGQAITNVTTSNDNAALFSVPPAIGVNGTLTFTPAAQVSGTATVTVIAQDDGGTENGGVNRTTNSFTLNVGGVNDAPSFTLTATSYTVAEDAGAQTIPNAVTNILAGPANEAAQTVSFEVSNNATSLFGAQPVINGAGTLTFTPAANAYGTATVTVVARDNGGTANGGVDASAPQTFTITVSGVNDAPLVTLVTNDLVVLEDAGTQTWTNFALFAAPVHEAGQSITNVLVSNNNSNLFSAQPLVDTNGTLTFTSAVNAYGSATVTVIAQDDGGTSNGGVDLSAAATFTITVTPVNDPPVANAGSNQLVNFPQAVNLVGTVSDVETPTNALTWSWSYQNGPGTIFFDDETALATTATFSTGGVYVIRLSVSDGELTGTSDMTVFVNLAPVVNAGTNQTVTRPAPAALNGSVEDDGLPVGASLTLLWSKLEGPGTVTFGSPGQPTTTATFSQAGTYRLQLLANDTAASGTNEVTITVLPSPDNLPPLVHAGMDLVIGLTNRAVLNGSVADDDFYGLGYLGVTWAMVSGPTNGTVTFTDTNAAVTTAIFSEPGTYVLRLTGDDGEYSASDEITVTIYLNNLPPIVDAGPDVVLAGLEGRPVFSSGRGTGRILVNHDEWTFSDAGFDITPDGATHFALNVASWFTRGRPGRFLAWSENFGLTGTNLATVLAGAGHQWTVDATLPFTLATLMNYDAVFLSGNAADNQVLIDYVRAGGSVYVCAGTGLGAVAEARQWNDFLREFGLEYAETAYNTVGGTYTVGSTHYVFRGVDQLYYLNGNSINKLDPYDPQSSLLQVIESDGTVAAFDPVGNPLVLHGTAIDDGKPVGSTLAFLWEKADGPGDVHFGSSNAPVTTVVFSAAGTYVLRLTASDGELSGTNELVVTVDGNEPPLVNAGSDQTITLPAQVLLQGSVTNDAFPVGSVVTTVWSKLIGPGEVVFANANQLTTTASFTVPGSYTLMLTASDAESSASDLVRVVVNRVCVTNLNGLAAWWPLDGTLSDFYGGNTGVPFVSAVFTNGNVGQGLRFDGSLDGVFIPASPALDVGLGGGLTIETWVRPATAYATYPFVTWATTNGAAATGVQLAMDFGGTLFAALTDTNGTAHVVAVPGPLPNGDGRLLRGSIFQHVAITYDQFSGAAALYLDGRAIVQTNLGSFVPQTSFDLWLGTVPGGAVLDGVLDEVAIHRRALAAEEIRAVVEANYNGRCKDLQVNAGLDLALVLPETRTLTGLVGGGPVLTGGVYQVTWSLVSGPTNGSVEFSATNALATTATFSAPGEYLLSLEATAGATGASDQVRVTVHPANTINQPPFVQAGSDQTNLIAHTFALNGSFTDDGLPGLAPTTARWRVFDGPTTDALFGDVSAPVTTVRFYTGGTYVLRLTANDGTYAGSDDVTIRVIQNFAPGVSAGATVTTSNYLAVLRGNVTDDGLPGTGVTRQWSQVSGPGTVTFATPSAPQTVASFPALGQYRLQLTATDGELTSSAEVIVNVVAPANQAPVVNAGSDRTVASGVAVRLDGSVRDDGQPTGNVTTTWSQLPGSGTASFSTVNGEWHVTLSGPGTFQLRLTASDGSLSASDDVELTAVSPTGSPSIQITAPTNNALFTAGDTLTLSASVSTPGTTARQVEFFLGDQPQGVVTNSPFDLSWVALVGTNSLTALVTDNLGQTALSLAVLVRVQSSPTNQPPLARADSTAVDRNTVDNLIVVLANDVDPDGDALAVATVSTPAHGTAGVAPGSSIVRYTPLAGFVGTDSFSYAVSDGFGGYATGAVTVVVGTTNRPPLALADALRVEPDSTGTVLSVLANDHDPDHDFFSLTNVSNATTGTVALYYTAGATQAYAVTYTPPVGYRGPAQFSYTVTDMHGASATGMVLVTVLEPNRIPSAAPDTFTVESDSLTNLFAVLANDTDPDADALVITGYQQPLHGSLFIVPGHTTLHYRPDPGYSGPDDFQYEVSDGRGGLAIGAVTITVRPPNNAPIALDDTLAVRTDSTNNVLLVLNNDSDPDGDPLVITTNTAPEFGTVSIAPGGTNLLYTALPGSTNTDTFTYTISDGRGGEATATVTVTVGGNTTPLARNDAASALVNSTDNVIPVLVNDADPDGDPLAITAVGTPSQGGAATISGTNVLYTPLTGFTGTESFTYTLGDGNGGEATATVTVTVSAPNVPPVAVADTAFVLTNSGPNIILVLTNDTDANLDTLFVSAITQPAHGSVVNQSTLVTYTPATGYLGNDSFTYVVGDGRGGYATGAVSVVVIESNTVPVAQDDLFRVFANGTTTSLRVLTNDTDADGHALTIVSTDTPTQGSVTILPGGTNLAYTAPVDITGWDSFTYTISDGRGGTATATVYVQLQVLLPPSIELTSPADGASYVGGATVPVTAAVYAPNTTVTRVEFFLDGLPWRVFTNPPYTFNWTAFAGTRELTAKVTDNLGQTAESDPVTITVSVPAGDANPPVAIITNLPPHVSQVDGLTVTNEIALIQDGLFALRGTADDADAGDAVSYRILLYLADGTFIADVTPGTVDADGFHAGRVSDAVLGTNNFTGLQNDIYELELVVRGGFQEARTRQRFALDSNLKVGQFSFTQQDMVIPVSGFPLTVLRTYNTFNPAAGDFGYSWTWSINDLDIVLDEVREDVEDIDDEFFSQRTGGGRDITLTLPDGRRTTFLFSLQPTGNGEEPWLVARWTAPPGVHATLTLTPGVTNILDLVPFIHWRSGDGSSLYPPVEAFDFPGFILTTKDGTQYHLDRPNLGDHTVLGTGDERSYGVTAYGKPYLKRIVQRNGNAIEISADRVQHFDPLGQPTRALLFVRNGEGRISAITDPNNQDTNGVAVGPPAVRYSYDTRGNLTQVHKLTSFNATVTNELTTTYVYDHPAFPHYLTRIIDPRGFTPLRSLYDDNGLLIGTVDAAGRTNTFVHDVNNRMETLYNRLGVPTYHRYDARGNVIETINALGKSTLRTYDDQDNLLTETDPLTNVTTYAYDSQGQRLSVTLPYPPGADTNRYTTQFTYDSFGNQTSVTSPTGAAQISEFDPVTGSLLALKDESNNVLVAWTYDANGNQTSETDVFGTTSFGFDGMGNANRMTNSLGQVIQSTYTLNGDIATLVENGVTSTFQYDSAGRETFADYGNGITVSYGNETFDTWTSVSGPTLGSMARSVDEQGRLAGWSMANGGTPGFAYDAEGRLEYETNAVGRVKRNFYDLVGRVSYVQDVTTGAGTAFGYDDAGRRISVTNTFSQVTRTAYNPDGSVAFTTNALGRVWQYLYDLPAGCCGGMAYGGQVIDPLGRTNTTVTSPHGLLLESVHPDGAKVKFTYLLPDSAEEGDQYPATITDEGNHVRGFGYNNFGQLTNATDLGSNAFTYVYQTGRLASVVGPDSQQLYGYTYDALDNRQTITYSDGGVATMGYGTNNKPTSILLPSTVGLTLGYDHAQRLTNRTSTLGEFARFSYNANDTVTAMTDNTGTTQFTPDAAGRTAEIVQPTGARVTYSYDLADRVTNVTVRASANATAYSTRYEYDAAGNLWRVTDPLNGVTVLLYDAANQLTNRTLPNGVVTTFSYNLRGQLTNLVHVKNGTVLAGAAYERQGVGEPARITREDGSYVDLGYDHAHRLTNETHRAAGGALVEQISYGYDVAGNRTSHVTAAGSHTYSYLGGHRLSTVTGPANQSFSWDTGGRVSSITRDSETLTLGYNSDDRLTSVSDGAATLTYSYDGQGRRVRATSGESERRFVVAPMANSDLESPHLVTDGANAVLGGFAYVGGQPLMRFDANGAATYYLEDAMGSVIALADSAGVPTALFAYDGFGNVRAAVGATNGIAGVGGDYRFHGHWFEETTGLYHARARDYDARTGRFIERDPVEGDFQRPETFHPYAFVNNNPQFYSDPTGLFTLVEINISGSIQQNLQAFRAAATHRAKAHLKDQVYSAVQGRLVEALQWLMPKNFQHLINQFGSRLAGVEFGKAVTYAFCKVDYLNDVTWSDAEVDRNGRPRSNGKPCEPDGPPAQTPLGNRYPQPDFILSNQKPMDRMGSSFAKGFLIGDAKLNATTLLRYFSGGSKHNQWLAITGYARENTMSKTALFITYGVGPQDQLKALKKKMQKDGAAKGINVVVVPMTKQKI